MIATHLFGVDLGGLNFALQPSAGQPIVDSPADVIGSGVAPMGPPGVVAIALTKESQCVDKPSLDEIINPGSLLGGVALFAFIGFWSG